MHRSTATGAAVSTRAASRFLTEALPIVVVAVTPGHEHAAARRIARVAGATADEVFALERECPRRKGGVWSLERSIAYPGYVFAALRDAEGFEDALALVNAPFRLLKVGDAPSMLDEDELAVVRDMGGAEHVIRTSFGSLAAGALTVSAGPLRGLERLIARIDTHRKSAWLVPLRHAQRGMRVGLEVVSKT